MLGFAWILNECLNFSYAKKKLHTLIIIIQIYNNYNSNLHIHREHSSTQINVNQEQDSFLEVRR